MLRTLDRFLAPVSWVAAALTALALLVGPSVIGAKTDKPAAGTAAAAAAPSGRNVFASNCAGCHTLARANASGTTGPDLDDAKPDAATVTAVVTGGKGSMPAFEGSLSGAEIAAVAAFVAGEEPAAAATRTATPAAAGDVTELKTDRGPDGITVGRGGVWVAAARAGTLQQFDAATGAPVGKPVAVGRQPDNPAVDGGTVWVVASGDDAVVRVAPDGKLTRIPVGDAPEDLAIAGDTVWVANAGDGTVTRIDRASARVTGEPIRVGPQPLGIAAGGGSVWVTSNDDGTVWRLDAATGKVRGNPIPVGARPRGVAVGGGSAWVANSGDDTVTRVRDQLAIPVGANPRDLAVDGGEVWVANAADDTISRIDAASGDVNGDPIEVGDDPIGIVAGEGAVWVSDFQDDTVSRVPIG